MIVIKEGSLLSCLGKQASKAQFQNSNLPPSNYADFVAKGMSPWTGLNQDTSLSLRPRRKMVLDFVAVPPSHSASKSNDHHNSPPREVESIKMDEKGPSFRTRSKISRKLHDYSFPAPEIYVRSF